MAGVALGDIYMRFTRLWVAGVTLSDMDLPFGGVALGDIDCAFSVFAVALTALDWNW